LISIPEILEALWSVVAFATSPLTAIPDRALVYASVLCCCLSAMAMAFYVHKKFSKATNALAVFSNEWQVAESEFLKVVDVAQRKMGALSARQPAAFARPPAPPADKRSFPLSDTGGDLPRQVAAMARRGFSPAEIGATRGLGEADVNVLFGMHRVIQRKK
jgi:hypothetical protein